MNEESFAAALRKLSEKDFIRATELLAEEKSVRDHNRTKFNKQKLLKNDPVVVVVQTDKLGKGTQGIFLEAARKYCRCEFNGTTWKLPIHYIAHQDQYELEKEEVA